MKKCFFRFIGSLMAVLFFAGIYDLSVMAQGDALQQFGFEVTTVEGAFTYTLNWWQTRFHNENEYYLALPDWEKGKSLKVSFSYNGEVTLNGEAIQNGQTIENIQQYNVIRCPGKEYYLHLLYSSNIASMHIITESGNIERVYENQDYKEPGYANVVKDGKLLYEGKLEYIKGRGNSSWDSSKKPFNIKFKDKANLFNMGAAKKWCLLPNYIDDTSLKNKLGYDFSKMVGFEYYPESEFVDLFIDGEYIGHYLLSEKVEIQKNRIKIADLEKMTEQANAGIKLDQQEQQGIRGEGSALKRGSSKWTDVPKDPENITGGYLLEIELADRYDEEACGFISDYGMPIVIKSPEYASKKQVEYISMFYQEFEDAVLSGDGYNQLGKHYSEYIDIESFAKMYVYQEFIKNVDGATTSLYLYKNSAGKLKAGPVWDVDLAFGVSREQQGIDMSDPQGKYITGSYLQNELSDLFSIFSLLCRHNDFRKEAQNQWEKYFAPNVKGLLDNLDELYHTDYVSIVLDKCKWSMDNADIATSIQRFDGNVDRVKMFITERSEFMTQLFSDDICYVEYNSNGGNGEMYDLENYQIGTKLQLEQNIYQNGQRKFLGWNTKASGWGKFYEDGSEILLEKDTTLYAQWDKKSFGEKLKSFFLGITGR